MLAEPISLPLNSKFSPISAVYLLSSPFTVDNVKFILGNLEASYNSSRLLIFPFSVY